MTKPWASTPFIVTGFSKVNPSSANGSIVVEFVGISLPCKSSSTASAALNSDIFGCGLILNFITPPSLLDGRNSYPYPISISATQNIFIKSNALI
jgi:hypothetical protein